MFISNVAREMGYDEDAISEIEMCVDQACANVIDHAYSEGDNDEIDPETSQFLGSAIVGIEISIQADSLTISILDNGVGSCGNFKSGVSDLDEYQDRERPRGLGLYIIKKLMDRVTIEFPENAGTRLTMTKLWSAMLVTTAPPEKHI